MTAPRYDLKDERDREHPKSEQAYLRSLPIHEAAQVMGSRAKLQRLLEGEKLDDILNEGKDALYHLKRMGEFGTMPRMEKLQQDYTDWARQVLKPDYKARHEFRQVGVLPDFVMADAAVMALNPLSNEIHISDHQLKHAMRDVKAGINKALPIDIISQLPSKLENAQWFYDSKHKNLLAVFDVDNNLEVGKSIVTINFKKKKDLYNAIVTSGIIQERTLRMDVYRELKKSP